MPVSESDRILAAGVTIQLAGDRSATLRYSLRSLKSLEDSFGDVATALERLNGLFDGSNTKKIGTIIPALAAGLIYEGIGEDALYDGTARPELMAEYLAAINEALDQAFPPARPGKADAAEDEPASSGATSTTPPTASVTGTNGSGA